MTETELKDRTRAFALRIIKLVDAIPFRASGKAIANQIVRAGTSVGANYRAACRGRSKAEFIAKLGTCEEEADECCYWLDLLEGSGLVAAASLVELRKEANELTAIFVSSIKTARGSKNA